MRWSGDGHAAALVEARDQQRARDVPAPARPEHGRGQQRLDEQVARRLGPEVVEHVLEREGVLRAEREHDRLLVGRRLELEAEAAAEALAQREAQRAVDAAAERRVQHQLHAARLVEEPLEDEPPLRRHRAEGLASRGDVLGDLARRLRRRRRSPPRPTPGSSPRVAQRRDRGRELARAAGALAEPERDRRRRAVRVGHPHDAGLDAQDPPRGVAELEDVAARRLDREVLVERADERALGLEQHAVVAGVGDRAAAEERRERARAASRAGARRRRRGAAARGGRRYGARPPRRSRRGRGRGRARRAAPGRRARPRPTARRRTRRRSAARGCRAARAAPACGRARRGGPRAGARPRRRARRG